MNEQTEISYDDARDAAITAANAHMAEYGREIWDAEDTEVYCETLISLRCSD